MRGNFLSREWDAASIGVSFQKMGCCFQTFPLLLSLRVYFPSRKLQNINLAINSQLTDGFLLGCTKQSQAYILETYTVDLPLTQDAIVVDFRYIGMPATVKM